MKSKMKKVYISPTLTTFGPMEVITQSGGGSGIDGIVGIDTDGDGNVDAGISVTNGPLAGSM